MADVDAEAEQPGGVDPIPRVLDRPSEGASEPGRSRLRLLLAADADRRSIERALHDGLQQDLVALAVNLRRVTDKVDEDPAGAKASLNELAALVRDTIDEAAKLAQQIYPARLSDGRGLASALRSAADHAKLTATIQAPTTLSAEPEMIAGIYWCCVDALSATPAGTQASVRVFDVEGGGVTFEVEVASTYSDELLDRLRDRVEALGGRLSLVGTADGGSRIEGTVPSAWG